VDAVDESGRKWAYLEGSSNRVTFGTWAKLVQTILTGFIQGFPKRPTRYKSKAEEGEMTTFSMRLLRTSKLGLWLLAHQPTATRPRPETLKGHTSSRTQAVHARLCRVPCGGRAGALTQDVEEGLQNC
jgi:hypothetical protein